MRYSEHIASVFDRPQAQKMKIQRSLQEAESAGTKSKELLRACQ
jgi:hypothetical protein